MASKHQIPTDTSLHMLAQKQRVESPDGVGGCREDEPPRRQDRRIEPTSAMARNAWPVEPKRLSAKFISATPAQPKMDETFSQSSSTRSLARNYALSMLVILILVHGLK